MATASPSLSANQAIRAAFGEIPEVQAVFVSHAGGTLSVTIAIPDFDLAVQDRIYEAEGELIDSFPGAEFDFSLVFLQGRQLREIMTPSGVQIISK